MENKNEVADLLSRGGVLFDVEGNNTSEIYRNICEKISLPNEVTKEGV